MITRIVKMTFRPEATPEFLDLFNASKALIARFEGCHSVQLFNDKSNSEVYFTLSVWESEDHLNLYRASDLFGEVWGKTKQLFAGKPEAWTLVSASE